VVESRTTASLLLRVASSAGGLIFSLLQKHCTKSLVLPGPTYNKVLA